MDPVPLGDLLSRNEPDQTGPRRSRRRIVVLWTTVLLFVVAVGAVVVPALGHASKPTAAIQPTPTPSPSAAAVPSPTVSPTPEELQDPSKPELVLDKVFEAPGPDPSLPWPDSGQAQVVVPGVGDLGHSGARHATPIASIAKVMTAYTVLRDHPLSAGQSGPTITVTQAEADAYAEQQANGESLIIVKAGEKISQRDLLKGVLVASGDNAALILARWDAGSVPAFVARMNSNARRLGMSSTHFTDPSGLTSSTVSTASDLLKLAPVAMSSSTLASLAGSQSATIPLNGTRNNPNSLLGVHGVVGIKTGTTTAAGGCMLFAARTKVGSKTQTIYGAVLGITGDRSAIHSNARDAADALVVGAGQSLHKITIIKAGTTVASYVGKDGHEVDLTVKENLTVVGWSGQKFRISLPSGLRTGMPAKSVIVRMPEKTVTVKLVKA